jgi:hypothetical protein
MKVNIKYSDKSEGQPALIPIFDRLKKILGSFAKDGLIVTGDDDGQYHIGIDNAGKIIFFASAMIQKGYVGFYYMPVATDPAIKTQLPEDLRKLLKGKSCFHIKKADETIYQHITTALAIGVDLYEKKGLL